jgi:hypothetical protein
MIRPVRRDRACGEVAVATLHMFELVEWYRRIPYVLRRHAMAQIRARLSVRKLVEIGAVAIALPLAWLVGTQVPLKPWSGEPGFGYQPATTHREARRTSHT